MTSARAVPLAPGALQAGAGHFAGWTVRETAGAVATVRLFDNASAGTGTLLAAVNLAADSSDVAYIGPIWAVNGVFAVITGTVEGSVFVG